MYEPVEKTPEQKSQSVANTISQRQCSNALTSRFVDNRPEDIQMRKLRGLAKNSPQNSKLRELHHLAAAHSVTQKKNNVKQDFGFVDNRPEAVAQRRLKGVVNNSQLDLDGRSSGPIQRMFVPPHRRNGAGPSIYDHRQRKINAVQAWRRAALPAAAGPGILVFHPPTRREPWEYTRTVGYTVPVPGLRPVTVRGHIHYNNSTGVVGPGRMWISGVNLYDFPTPAGVVTDFEDMPDYVEREIAVHNFNARWGTTYNTL